MSELQIFNNNEIEKLKSIKPQKPYQGFFYIVEYGVMIKIGSSINPFNRYTTFKREAHYNGGRIGRIAISCSHTNFRDNESELHKKYARARIEGTELFNLPFDEVVRYCWQGLTFNFNENDQEDGGLFNNLKELIFPNRNNLIARNNAILAATIANSPCLLLGSDDGEIVENDLRYAAELNSEIMRCIFELGMSTAVPFLIECRQIVHKPTFEKDLRERIAKLGTEMLERGVEIPLEMVKVMEAGHELKSDSKD